jgi:hypothetical protein
MDIIGCIIGCITGCCMGITWPGMIIGCNDGTIIIDPFPYGM